MRILLLTLTNTIIEHHNAKGNINHRRGTPKFTHISAKMGQKHPLLAVVLEYAFHGGTIIEINSRMVYNIGKSRNGE